LKCIRNGSFFIFQGLVKFCLFSLVQITYIPLKNLTSLQ
jgi:hypothetical protein